jgi:dTDP-4-amino-4,6-dideoxygalactose transaminase
MSKLAIFGGKPVRKKLFPYYSVIGKNEKLAAGRVIDRQVLSKFFGSWHPNFYGGPEVKRLEKNWAEYFGVKHAIAMNSCTSGLYAAVGAANIGPGDEVIVTPYTMSASATAILVFNGIPVFADIEQDHFCIDPASVEERITPSTKAIIAVDLFGHPYDADRINRIAKKHSLIVIEDAAQAPAALYKRKCAGTLADIGVYSLNYHKHIHCGEGGIAVTDNEKLAERLRLIRNHAEGVVEDKGERNIGNMLGFNFRMTEIEAAIANEQLKKLERLVSSRIKNCKYMEEGLRGIGAIIPPPVATGCRHVYYLHSLRFKEDIAGIGRDPFIKAVKAELACTEFRQNEGPRIYTGYTKPLYLQPVYQKRILYGGKSCPFGCALYKRKVDYARGLCPTAEKMHYKELFWHDLMHSDMTRLDMDDVTDAFWKVWENRAELAGKGQKVG